MTTILNRVKKDYILKMGEPEYVLTDNGTQFTAKRLKIILNEKNISN